MSEASQKRYLSCISEQFPTVQSLYTEIINLKAILNLPKGTEHFMSDIHGEYDAFLHILNNCSGVVREKALLLFSSTYSAAAISDLLTLIYYPKEKLKLLGAAGRLTKGWYNGTLHDLIELSRLLSSKYTRSKVRKAMPSAYAYILDELLHALPDEDDNQLVYHQKIIDALIDIGSGDEFIVALCSLIKRLAVDRLHIVGDIYDRGPHADGIMDLLVDHHAVDIEWGNHDILWMGSAAGNPVCMAAVVRGCLQYDNMELLETGYGISLRSLALFASQNYPGLTEAQAALQAVTVILFKLEGQLIARASRIRYGKPPAAAPTGEKQRKHFSERPYLPAPACGAAHRRSRRSLPPDRRRGSGGARPVGLFCEKRAVAPPCALSVRQWEAVPLL